jgi:hypothetical protein
MHDWYGSLENVAGLFGGRESLSDLINSYNTSNTSFLKSLVRIVDNPPIPGCVIGKGGFKVVMEMPQRNACCAMSRPDTNVDRLKSAFKEAVTHAVMFEMGGQRFPKLISFRCVNIGNGCYPIIQFCTETQRLKMTMYQMTQRKEFQKSKVAIRGAIMYSCFMQVFASILWMEERGIKHNDLKPDNIMAIPTRRKFIECGAHRVPTYGVYWCLVDFGEAKTPLFDEPNNCNGGDLFKFAWWSFHVIKKIPAQQRELLCSCLRLKRSDIHSNLLPKCMQNSSSEILDYSVLNGDNHCPNNEWQLRWGWEKKKLYKTQHAIRDFEFQDTAFLMNLFKYSTEKLGWLKTPESDVRETIKGVIAECNT